MNLAQIDFLSPEFRKQPYPVYQFLHQHSPVLFVEEMNCWFLSRLADCSFVLRDLRFGNHPTPGNSMLFQNPPDHTRLRNLVQLAFTPRRTAAMRPHIQEICDRLLDEMAEKGESDLIADLAYQLPVIVIAEMMGVPPEDHAKFAGWSQALVNSLDMHNDPQRADASSAAVDGFVEYFEELIAARRRHPQDDLLGALVAAEEAGDRLTHAELHTTCRLLLIAGHETTVGLIGNGMLALLRHPQKLEQLRQNPALIRTAVEELLRFDSPIQMVGRNVLEDVSYNGHEFRAGQYVGCLTGAAGWDPSAFDNPTQLDLTRDPNPHLAFGLGIHYCLGAPLARMEGQIAINSLLQRFPRMELLEEDPPLRDNFVFRGRTRMPVKIGL